MSNLVIALALLVSSSFLVYAGPGGRSMGEGEDESTNLETRAMYALYAQLKPVMEKVQEAPLVDCATTSNLCFGKQLTEDKIAAAGKSCGDNMYCFMKALNWIGEDGNVQRRIIREDLAKTPLAESMRGAEQQCFESRRTIKRKTVKAVLRGDATQFLEAVYPFECDSEDSSPKGMRSMEMEEQEAQGRMHRYGKGKGKTVGHDNDEEEDDMEDQQPVFEGKIKVTRKLLRAARDMAYVGCIHIAFQKACSKKATNILKFQPDQNCPMWQGAWTKSELVPAQLCKVPPPANVLYPSGAAPIMPGTTMFTQNLQEAPYVCYDNDPNSLYTLMVVDVDIPDSRNLFHWMRVNIPGGNVQEGTDVFDYLPSFAMDFQKDEAGNGFLNTDGEVSNRHLILVYRQPGPIEPAEGQLGCNSDMIKARFMFEDKKLCPRYFVEKYALEGPVAGNFIRVAYSGAATKDMLCRVSKCLGSPFPCLLTGINDKPECSAP